MFPLNIRGGSRSRSRSRSRSPMDMDRPPQARRPCREYEEQGHCPRGADCPYDHRPAEAMVAGSDYDYRGPVCRDDAQLTRHWCYLDLLIVHFRAIQVNTALTELVLTAAR
jgi:hypothetical protein